MPILQAIRRSAVAALAVGTLLSSSLFAQSPTLNLDSKWFPREQLMTIGVYYYPEAWPESQWERDMANMRKMGMEFVHMGEFAWYFMEPVEGKFDFAWLDKSVDLAAKQGMKVVLCTPSATPPVWLSRNHPEILMVDRQGRTMDHGSREQGDWSSPVFREYVTKIDTELAKHYGNNPNVAGWQIDNELSHYDRHFSYSDAAKKSFREFLQEKYGSIDKLNDAWGGAFWSEMYQSFDQIDLPNTDTLVADGSPHAFLDFRRWFAHSATDYLRMQATALRKYARNQWITTNFMSMHEDIDPSRSVKDLDVFTSTLYPVHGQLEEGSLGFRLGSAEILSFGHDFLRPLSGIEGNMELQPGQVNWGAINPWPLPGAIHMWLIRAFAGGSRIQCTYRFRQPLYNSELYHKGLVETDGVTPSPGGLEYSEAARDMVALRKQFNPNAKEPASYAARRTAFLINYDNRWDITNHSQTTRWSTEAHWFRYYRALKSMTAPVDVITEDREFSNYPFLIAPAYQLLDQGLVDRWTRYVENGGHLILTCRTGQKDRRGHLWEALWAGPINKLIGAGIPLYDVLPVGVNGQVSASGKQYAWGSWGEILKPDNGTQVLATYADQFYANRPAAVHRKIGKGSVTYIGVDTLDGELECALLHKVYGEAGAAPTNLAPNFFVDWRDGFWVATNFSSNTETIPAGPAARVLVGTRDVAPGQVAIWLD